eukprot:GDKI01029901.1.p1 GENE.GDKI01029901.1~~GDKI01029901.1.p1  ORF type:complete len:167 (-),score=18.29 GDKI01029901.1:57-557(-)
MVKTNKKCAGKKAAELDTAKKPLDSAGKILKTTKKQQKIELTKTGDSKRTQMEIEDSSPTSTTHTSTAGKKIITFTAAEPTLTEQQRKKMEKEEKEEQEKAREPSGIKPHFLRTKSLCYLFPIHMYTSTPLMFLFIVCYVLISMRHVSLGSHFVCLAFFYLQCLLD